jgi:gliding motility-associated protein GldM
MALPREPRQKMINMMYLVLTALLALNVSSEILNAFKTVNKSLETTNVTVDKSTATIMKSLEDKQSDPSTAAKARVWYPRAQQAQQYAKEVYDYIQGLKNEIIRKAGGDVEKKSFKADNLDIATRMFVEKGQADLLRKKLEEFKSKLLGINDSIKLEFQNTLPINTEVPTTVSKSNRTFARAYFHMVPTVAALTILSKFQNDVKTTENRVVQFCHNKVGEVTVRFDQYAPIIGQNSTYLMPGQEIEITAGVGAYSTAAKPTISIGGQSGQIGPDGTVTAKMTAGGVGSHSIPVHITYIDQDGNQKVLEKNVEYVVGSANASIALDKMNVLYIGVDNPVTIAASGGGDDKVQASITQGSLTKIGPGKYIARVNSVADNVRINVSVEGKLAGAAEFRVRTVPKAQAYVGGMESGATMAAGQFRAQTGVGAGIKDFPFDLKYTVTSFTFNIDTDEGDIATAQCQGNLFSPLAQSHIRTHAKAGKTITIDDIRVLGPDGRNTSAPSLVYYIK